MDASTNVLAEEVRAKRVAVDNDLELLRVRLQEADPRRMVDAGRWARTAVPIVAGTAAVWLWARRRRSVNSLHQLLIHGLNDLYRDEHQLLPALQRMSAKASNPELQKAFEHHRLETEGHVERLERVFRSVGAKPKSRKGSSDAVAAIVAEGERLLKARAAHDVRDAWLIATAQRIEHIEIATYGTVRTYAETLGFTYAADLLQQTLEEERAADEKLSNLAERFVNPQSIRTPPKV
jgi:ferritin-like metal-binding protein YciE